MKKIIVIILLGIISISTKIYAYSYHIEGNIEEQLDCWIGWKKYHYGDVGVTAKKGDTFEYAGSPYITMEGGVPVLHEGEPYTVTTNGYGYYSLEFNKHVLSLLSYMKGNANSLGNYKTEYEPPPNTLVSFTPNEIDGTVNLTDALNIAINDMLSNWYSSSYENGEFATFWKATFLDTHKDDLRKIQNKFYWNAYGESAYKKLLNMLSKADKDVITGNSKEKADKYRVLKGVLFSIMEARYRNKNVQGKMNLQIKAAEGELWPFLVYLGNLNDISYDKEGNKYVNSDGSDVIYKFPDFDTLIEGAYQWMVYSDADTIRDTSHRTITTMARANSGSEDNEIEIEWESEFLDLTWDYLPALNGKRLEEFYSRCQQVRSIFKKSSENAMGMFGAEELYDITSDKNFSEAMKDMKTAMKGFCGSDTMDSVWTGLTNYNIERTYLMAKNIVETNRVQDEFAYYDIGTNILTYTYGRHGKEYLLMDFQRVKLLEPLKDKDDNWTNVDTDCDGILDRNELGDESNVSDSENALWEKVDITKFIKKAIEKELYGTDDEALNTEDGKLMVENTLAQVKYNIYKERQKFINEHPEDNICDRKEDKENYLNIDSVTENSIKGKTDAELIVEMKKDSAKLQVRLYKYKSNPVLKDTDFDGIEDGFGYKRDDAGEYLYIDGEKVSMELNAYKDKTPKDNYFEGRMHSTRLSGDKGIDVNMNMDYRYFFMSNKLYYDELSTMSLLYSNSIYRKGKKLNSNKFMDYHSGLQLKSGNNFTSGEDRTSKTYKYDLIKNMDLDKFNNMPIKEMMIHFGFENVRTYYMGEDDDEAADGADVCRGYKDTHKGKVALGYKNIEYHGLYKTVIGIVIRGTAEDDDWDSDFDMGDLELRDKLEDVEPGIENYNNSYNNTFSQLSNGVLDKYDKKYSKELLHFAGGYPDWKWDYHHAGFDIVSNRILEIVKEYYDEVEKHFDDDIELFDGEENKYVDGGVCYWITGHSMGAGVANLVASSLICSNNIESISGIGGNENNVYCYTFASPNTFYLTDNMYEQDSYVIPGKKVTGDYREPHGVRYRCIFNIINDDDFVPKLPMEECAWTRYGRVAIKSIEKDIKPKLKEKDSNLEKNDYITFIKKKYNSDIKKISTLIRDLNEIYIDVVNMRKDTYDFNKNSDYETILSMYDSLIMGDYTKPYQKTYNGSYAIKQLQVPAYFMQSIAYAKHDGIFNSLIFKTKRFASKYYNSRTKLIDCAAPWAGKIMDYPHYLESYFSLTKELEVNDFR